MWKQRGSNQRNDPQRQRPVVRPVNVLPPVNRPPGPPNPIHRPLNTVGPLLGLGIGGPPQGNVGPTTAPASATGGTQPGAAGPSGLKRKPSDDSPTSSPRSASPSSSRPSEKKAKIASVGQPASVLTGRSKPGSPRPPTARDDDSHKRKGRSDDEDESKVQSGRGGAASPTLKVPARKKQAVASAISDSKPTAKGSTHARPQQRRGSDESDSSDGESDRSSSPRSSSGSSGSSSSDSDDDTLDVKKGSAAPRSRAATKSRFVGPPGKTTAPASNSPATIVPKVRKRAYRRRSKVPAAAPVRVGVTGNTVGQRAFELAKTTPQQWNGTTKGAEETLIALARSKGVALTSVPQRGLKVTGNSDSGQVPPTDFAGYRSRQVLHHHSEVVRWHLQQTEDPVATAADLKRFNKNKDKRDRARKQAGYKKMKDEEKSAWDEAYLSNKNLRKGLKAARSRKYKPVEVQSMYYVRDGVTTLTTSANQHRSQQYLAQMSKADVARMYQAALDISDESARKDPDLAHVRQAAAKVMDIEGQNRARMETDQERVKQGLKPLETKEDMEWAQTVADLARRGRYTVVINSGERHAEQTLFFDQKNELEQAGLDPKTEMAKDDFDVAGTFIRCGACGSQLGPDTKHTAMNQREEDREAQRTGRPSVKMKNTGGNWYSAQTDQPHFEESVEAVQAGEAVNHSGDAWRPRSPSPFRGSEDDAREAARAYAKD